MYNSSRLTDVENSEGRIHLVFECIDMSLTTYIIERQKVGGIPLEEVKVWMVMSFKCSHLHTNYYWLWITFMVSALCIVI